MNKRILLVSALSEAMLRSIRDAIVEYASSENDWKAQTRQYVPYNKGPRDKYGRLR